jgi:guanylate kinase
VDYHFWSKEAFEEALRAGGLLEYAEVHGHYYGTPAEPVLEMLAEGRPVVMDLDVQGAAQLRACADPRIQSALVDVFVLPPSLEELLSRLSGRGTESREQLDLRLKNAQEEMAQWRSYTYTVISADRDADYQRVVEILDVEGRKSHRISPPSFLEEGA